MATVVEVPAMTADSAGLLMSPEEFDAIVDYDDCYRYELIHRMLVVTPIPLEEQANPHETLGGFLFLYKGPHPLGESLDLTLPERYLFTGSSRRQGDRVIWAGLGRRPNPKLDPPTIAVESVSASKRNWRRDFVTKRGEYRSLGVVEYWIFDRFQWILTVYRNTEQQEIEFIMSEGESYRTERLPGFEPPLSRLLDAADVWRDLF